MTEHAIRLRTGEFTAIVLAILAVFSGCTTESGKPSLDAARPAETTQPPTAVMEQSPARDKVAEQTPPPAAGPVEPEAIDKSSARKDDSVVPANVVLETTRDQLDTVAGEEDQPQQARTVFFRADAKHPASMPVVIMTKSEEALCRVKVGDALLEIELEQSSGGRVKLAELAGKTATLVVFWKSDRRMAHQQLADLGPDVVEPFGKLGVAVAGIAVEESAASAKAALERADAKFPNLLDADGAAFAKVGSGKFPRTYLLDPQGKILWFDMEYSITTRRELHQALRAVTEEHSLDAVD